MTPSIADAPRRDRGAVLPLVLVFVLVLGVVLAVTARYATTNLRYSNAAEDRAEAVSVAEAAINYTIERVEANAVAPCDGGTVTLAPTHDTGSDSIFSAADSVEMTCTRLDGGQATMADWAAVITADGIGSANHIEIDEEGPNAATGRIFMESLRQPDLRINIEDVSFDGNLFYDGSGDDCASIDRYVEYSSSWDDDIVMESGSFVCWPQSWTEIVDEPPIATLPAPQATDPAWVMVGACRVFEPGWYRDVELLAGGHNYFKSGVYVFEDDEINTSWDPITKVHQWGTTILAGYSNEAALAPRLWPGGPCEVAQRQDALDGGPEGVAWYFGGDSTLIFNRDTTMEMVPMRITDAASRQHAVSIHVLGPGSALPSTLVDGERVIDEVEGTNSRALFQGQIWAPTQPVDLYELAGDANGQITSGVVAARLLFDSTFGPVGAIGPDRTQIDHELLLSATAVVDDVVVEAHAVVDHRPSGAAGGRVAVNSIRIDD